MFKLQWLDQNLSFITLFIYYVYYLSGSLEEVHVIGGDEAVKQDAKLDIPVKAEGETLILWEYLVHLHTLLT